jgi:hypothetical protein
MIARAAPAQEKEQADRGRTEQRGAGIIDAMRRALVRVLEPDGDQRQRSRADRQVNVEDPSPGERVGDDAAEERPRHAARGEDAAEQALVAAPFAWRDDVADGGLGQRHQASRAEPLQRAKEDQLEHGLRQPAQHRTDKKDADRHIEEPLAAVDVAELAVERRGRGGGDHERCDDPREMLEAAEIADDARQRRADDVLVEGGEGERQHQPGEDEIELAFGNSGQGRGRGSHGSGKSRGRRVMPC